MGSVAGGMMVSCARGPAFHESLVALVHSSKSNGSEHPDTVKATEMVLKIFNQAVQREAFDLEEGDAHLGFTILSDFATHIVSLSCSVDISTYSPE